MRKKPYLTKSKFLDANKCEKWLWHSFHNRPPYEDPVAGSVQDIGNRVGRFAHKLFLGGVEVSGEGCRGGKALWWRRRGIEIRSSRHGEGDERWPARSSCGAWYRGLLGRIGQNRHRSRRSRRSPSQKNTSRNFSLCLHGPPGTGKSMFARHLAKKLDMEVLQKRASDLISMWVGGTEKNIAEAFAEAQKTGSFLIFDQADSLLGDRRSARASWEISQVNEMLTWMESHDLPFVCTTNLSEMLDQASLRRFTFKLHFKPLAGKRLAVAFRHFFGNDAPSELLSIQNLTPGDFAVVKRRASFTGDLGNVGVLVGLLRSESRMKETGLRPIGFARPLTKELNPTR